MQKLFTIQTISTLKTTLKTALSAAALLLLSTNIQAKRQSSATQAPAEQPRTQKYHIAVANLSNQQVRVGLRKEGDKGVRAHATEFLGVGQNIDRVIDRKLNLLLVRGHGMNEKVYSLDPEKGAMFLIERNDAGDSFMVTAFVNDHEGWLAWRDAVNRAKAKLNQ